MFPLSPLLLPRLYFFALLFTSHRSPVSERLEQAMEGSARMAGVSNFGNRTPIVRLTSIEFGNRLRGRGVLPYMTTTISFICMTITKYYSIEKAT